MVPRNSARLYIAYYCWYEGELSSDRRWNARPSDDRSSSRRAERFPWVLPTMQLGVPAPVLPEGHGKTAVSTRRLKLRSARALRVDHQTSNVSRARPWQGG